MSLKQSDGVLWHRRFGHSSNMQFLNKIANEPLELDRLKKCITCIKGKQSRLPFGHRGTRATDILDIVHSDVCGPMPVRSLVQVFL